MPTQANAEHDPQSRSDGSIRTQAHEIPTFTNAPTVEGNKGGIFRKKAAALKTTEDKTTSKNTSKEKDEVYENLPIPKADIEALANQYDGLQLIKEVFKHYVIPLRKAGVPEKRAKIIALKYICRHFHLTPTHQGNRLKFLKGKPTPGVAEFATAYNHWRSGQAQVYLEKLEKNRPKPQLSPEELPKEKPQLAIKSRRDNGWMFYGNGMDPIIHGDVGDADFIIDLNEIMPAMGATFGSAKISGTSLRKFYRQVDLLLEGEKQIKQFLRIEKAAKVAQFALGGGRSRTKRVNEALFGRSQKLLTDTYYDIQKCLLTNLGKLSEAIVDYPVIDKQAIYKQFNPLLKRHQKSPLNHKVYGVTLFTDNKTRQSRLLSTYSPSRKHPGYFLRRKGDGSFQDENDSLTAFWKVEGNDVEPYLLNSKK